MPSATLTVPDTELVKVTEATRAFTGIAVGSLKELLAATCNQVVEKWERETGTFKGPGIS